MGVRFKLHPSHLWEGWPESIIRLSMPQSSYSSYGGAWGLWKVFENCLKDRQSQGNHPRVCAISDHIICIVSVWFRCMLHRPWDLMNTSLWRITFVYISKKITAELFFERFICIIFYYTYACMFLYMREGACEGQRRASAPWSWSSPALSRTSFLSRKSKQEDLGEILHWFLSVPVRWWNITSERKSLSDLKFQRENCIWWGGMAASNRHGGRNRKQRKWTGSGARLYIFSKPIPYLPQQGHTL